jgi:hypothetical protein
MVDIGDMARRLSDLFPAEAAKVLAELENAVVYNRHTSDVNVGGLSAYYLYGGRRGASHSLETYESLRMVGDYTRYLRSFTERLIVGRRDSTPPIVPGIARSNGSVLWPHIAGQPVTLYPAYSSLAGEGYSVPAQQNGRDVDLIVFQDRDEGTWSILGIRQREEYILQKGVDPIVTAETIAFSYQDAKVLGSSVELRDTWKTGRTVRIHPHTTIEWRAAKAA